MGSPTAEARDVGGPGPPPPLPSQVHGQGAALQGEQPGLEPATQTGDGGQR